MLEEIITVAYTYDEISFRSVLKIDMCFVSYTPFTKTTLSHFRVIYPICKDYIIPF